MTNMKSFPRVIYPLEYQRSEALGDKSGKGTSDQINLSSTSLRGCMFLLLVGFQLRVKLIYKYFIRFGQSFPL